MIFDVLALFFRAWEGDLRGARHCTGESSRGSTSEGEQNGRKGGCKRGDVCVDGTGNRGYSVWVERWVTRGDERKERD